MVIPNCREYVTALRALDNANTLLDMWVVRDWAMQHDCPNLMQIAEKEIIRVERLAKIERKKNKHHEMQLVR